MATTTKTPSTQKLYQIECAPVCGFLARNHNKAELGQMAQLHMKNTHNTPLAIKDAEAMMRPA